MSKRKPAKGNTTSVTGTPDYNGHPSRHHWSVALNIGNYEHIYTFALKCLKEESDIKRATRRFCACYMHDLTAEGYEYTYETVLRALEGMKE